MPAPNKTLWNNDIMLLSNNRLVSKSEVSGRNRHFEVSIFLKKFCEYFYFAVDVLEGRESSYMESLAKGKVLLES
jgi:hypothetical protein